MQLFNGGVIRGFGGENNIEDRSLKNRSRFWNYRQLSFYVELRLQNVETIYEQEVLGPLR